MRYVIVLLTVLGFIAASLALREHYNTESSPCSINDKWDCGIVNKSPYAELSGVPVAVLGMAGYTVIALLALAGRFRLTLAAALGALAFSLWLTYVEARILQVWCIYCVTSLGIISSIALLALAGTVWQLRQELLGEA